MKAARALSVWSKRKPNRNQQRRGTGVEPEKLHPRLALDPRQDQGHANTEVDEKEEQDC